MVVLEVETVVCHVLCVFYYVEGHAVLAEGWSGRMHVVLLAKKGSVFVLAGKGSSSVLTRALSGLGTHNLAVGDLCSALVEI